MKSAKSIVITGGSSGIGAALTKAFTADGHQLFVCARSADDLAQVAKENPSVFNAICDVGCENDVKRFFEQVSERTASVDVLVHCAGIIGPVGPVAEVSADEWFAALRTNLLGAFLVVKYMLPLMMAQRRPRILLLSGGGAFDPMPNLSAYGVSKAGIVRLVETLAVELAPRNIAVNAFAPGFVATPIFRDIIRAGPERGGAIYETVVKLLSEWNDDDIAVPIACARFLISDAAAALTGKTISARHDPWGEPEFEACLREIVESRLYATQRTNLDHFEGEPFARRLREAMERRKQTGTTKT